MRMMIIIIRTKITENKTKQVRYRAAAILVVIYDLHGQTIRFMVWVNGSQSSGLVNFVPESPLPFVQISSIYRKTAAKALNWYQRWL